MGLDHVDQYPRDRPPPRGRHYSSDGDVGRLPDRVRSDPGAGGMPHRLHVGKAAVSARTAIPTTGTGSARSTAASCSSLWRRHAPNLEDAVIDSFTRSPLNVARSLPNMREGDLLVGAFTNGQIGYHRPFPGRGPLSRPSSRSLSLRVQQPSRRQYHRASRLQRRAGDPRRPRHQGRLDAAADRRAA